MNTDDFGTSRVNGARDIFDECNLAVRRPDVPAEKSDTSLGFVVDEDDFQVSINCQFSIIFVVSLSVESELPIFICVS